MVNAIKASIPPIIVSIGPISTFTRPAMSCSKGFAILASDFVMLIPVINEILESIANVLQQYKNP